ncbi:hypothetical protein ACJMK2_019549 [Sinanodonta woodiana]|uniref:RING-type E3 ubiquitin transferase n=1 Tax=Sinanodonta woodiana TaxID=1069815 RepID=A0ABD3TWE0_SINWO
MSVFQNDNEDRPDGPQPRDGPELIPGPPQTGGNIDERSGDSQQGSRSRDAQFQSTALIPISTSEPIPLHALTPGLGDNFQPQGENATSSHTSVSQFPNLQGLQGLRVLTEHQESPADFRSPKRRRVKSPAKAGDGADDNDEEGECCSICFENWTNSGNHRLCSLKCGHLFGQGCIEKWLRGQGGKCPQCNAKAKRQDIRVIYAKSIKALDTAERDRVLQELEKERELRRRLEMDAAQIRMQYQMAVEECNRLKGDIDSLKQQLQKSRTTGIFGMSQSSPTKNNSQPLLVGQFTLDKTIKICEGGNCRVMAYCQSQATLVVSQPSASPLFPGFGVKKINTLDFKSSQYLMLHSKVIRDLAFHPIVEDGMLLSCGLDKKVKMTSIISNAVVQSFETPMPAWSCVWNVDDSNYFYTGLQNGIVLEFDVRNTQSYVQELNQEGNKSPVAALQYLGKNHQALFSPGGLLVGQLDRVIFFEKKGSNERRPHILPLDGSLTSLCVEERTRHILASFRPTARHQTIRHQMCEMVCNNISNNPTVIDTVCSCNIIHTFHGSRTQTVLSKSIILPHPSDQNRLMVCGADEPNQSVHIWDTGTGQMKQRLPAGGVVVDTCAININNQLYLAALTDKQLKIFKWS